MKNSNGKLILISFIMALMSTIGVFAYLKHLKQPVQSAKSITIIVAAENIPARTLIEKKMLKEYKVAENTIFNDYAKDSSKIIGKYTKEAISINEGFNKNNIIDTNTNDVDVKIENNHRAVSINVTGDSAVSDLLKPEDFVDIISYFQEKKDGQKIIRPDIAKIILQNIKVLGIDKQINREDNTRDKVPNNYLVTLSVPISDVEKLVLAEDIGSLKLVLRPLDNEKSIDTKGVQWQDIVGDVLTDSNTNSVSNNSSGQSIEYTVKDGDTLKKISEAFYGDSSKYTLLKQFNNLENEDYILTGEVIKIPVLQK